jgi:alkylation response protein AidB-like acyl-CoA dehydrogenase
MTDHFEFSDEMAELRTLVREFCAERSPEAAVRIAMESGLGHDPDLWRSLGAELGVLGLAVPEADGGDGVGLVYQAVVLEELGGALLPGPVLGTLCLAIPALAALSDGQAKKDYLPGLIGGEQVATLAVPTADGTFAPDRLTVSAALDAGAWSLTGTAAYVPDGAAADLILVAAAGPDGVALFAVDGAAAGVTRTQLFTIDRTRRQATIAFDGAAARLIAGPQEAAGVCRRALLTATALLAVSQVGGAQRMLDVTVEHARTRFQFGQSIGAFQAVKHRCANMLIEVEQARSAAYHAVWSLEDGDDDPGLAVALAKAVASDAYAMVSRAAIQLHGGQGFTWEASPQLYFKRATADLLTLGTGTEQTENVARLVLDEQIPAANLPGRLSS